jgi:lipopolysaccharide/colanic/teichoic acid biosynthesis glycosyltransferase
MIKPKPSLPTPYNEDGKCVEVPQAMSPLTSTPIFLNNRKGYESLKRGLDLVLSIIGLVISCPLMLAIGIAIKMDSPGPAIFLQWRAGRDGRPFRMCKFRTMVHIAKNTRALPVAAGGRAQPVLKSPYDPRVTHLGRFLRRWSLDELPQLLNVLKGEMSLVGPRPEVLGVANMYSPRHMRCLKATPGITGPMQVSGRAGLSLEERVRLELAYIERASLRTDMVILARTLPAVIRGDGAY